VSHGVDEQFGHANGFQNFYDINFLVESFLSIVVEFFFLVGLGLTITFWTLTAHPLQVCEKAHALTEIVAF